MASFKVYTYILHGTDTVKNIVNGRKKKKKTNLNLKPEAAWLLIRRDTKP